MTVTPLDAFPPELSDPDDQLRPHDFFARMHDAAPVRWDENRGCWDVFGYDAVRAVASDPERFSSRMDANPDYVADDGRSLLADSMLHADPPRHDDIKAVVDDWFSPDALAGLRPFVERRTQELLDDAVGSAPGARTEFDLASAVSYPLTVETIGNLIGVPPADRDRVTQWTSFTASAPDDVADGAAVQASLLDYFEVLLADRRNAPGDDLATNVALAEHLSPAERRNVVSVILLGGLSTSNLLNNAVWSIDEGGVGDAVPGDGDAVERAVEETLRYRSPVQAHSRYAVADATVAGESVEPGDHLCLWYAAANHDPAVFDDPSRFVPDRDPNPHLAFGHGTHYCLGAHLARLVATVALGVLLERFEELSVRTDALEPTGSMLVYGPSTMPVTVD